MSCRSRSSNPVDPFRSLRRYISRQWPALTRQMSDALLAVQDDKLGHTDDCRWPLYVSASENIRLVRDRLRRSLAPEAFRCLDIRSLSGAPEQITEHGLVYLPGRYVVPGGRFNEMYGWDSFFIARGLLCEDRISLAQSMADLQLYQVQHYGTVLNSNRTYHLTRSHPPLLGQLVLAVFHKTKDTEWLRRALPWVERYHAYWSSLPQFIPGVELSRYYALGDGHAPEVLRGEVDSSGRNHYDRLKVWLREHASEIPNLHHWYHPVSDSLTLDAYKDDRTVRESGFDLTGRFGPCGLGIRDFAPVCLNTLLWRMETDIAEIRRILSASPQSVEHWENEASARAIRMNKYFWDESTGLFCDWQLSLRKRRQYPFATTFWPLWAGWATSEQAHRVAENLTLFETPHGLLTSTTITGCQWDAPFMWAPLVLMAVEGLQRYGYATDADRIARKFINTVNTVFLRTGLIFEKYRADSGSEVPGEELMFGYSTNESGFGWTNAAISLLSKVLRD